MRNGVKVWTEHVNIPTYEVGEADKNPMFLEKRVYQGSSGKVYPLPIIDKIYDEKVDKVYEMVYLENEYLKIAILPELGGRIQRAIDKTNDYDFVYYNQVIKPALVGLVGPWISGGIEFNWPQHHRPTTFSPVEYYVEENVDGSKTVWVGEIDRMYGTKGMAGFTLYPDKAYLEIKGQLYNCTQIPQTFLWWANPAVAVNDYTKSIFPPDVHAVFDHGKRDVSKFPIATGEYYKMDYSEGVDIGMYKNISVPTSFMAYHSDYDFVGGYDFGQKAGILHIADHHVSPGKKQWTWGNGDFGESWDRNLTDEDGPYIELMTGMFTDNQPDFTWLQPYETKTFKQYFMPYKNVGEVKNANIDVAVNLEIDNDMAEVIVYTTGVQEKLKIVLKDVYGNVYLEQTDNLSPTNVYSDKIKINDELEKHEYILLLLDNKDLTLIEYTPEEDKLLVTPDRANAPEAPEDMMHIEDLYLTGLHLEQYRHATYYAEDYYLEGLKRNPKDARINNAYGLLLFRRGLFNESEKYVRAAVDKLTLKNPNPYDGEPYYNLGLALRMQGKLDEAYDAFYKATWNGAYQDSGFYSLAQILCCKEKYKEAEELALKSIYRNHLNNKARLVRAIALRKIGKIDDAIQLCKETLELDKLDFAARLELSKLYKIANQKTEHYNYLNEFKKIVRGNHNNYIELSIDYAYCGQYEEGIELLSLYVDELDIGEVYPEVFYYIGYFNSKLNNNERAVENYKLGEKSNSDYCFPNKLFSILVLEDVINTLAVCDKAKYYLGCLLYDKKQYDKAMSLWKDSISDNDQFPTVYRNLALAYYNKKNDSKSCLENLRKAFELNKKDARVLFELDQLYKKLGVNHDERVMFLQENIEVVQVRDDLFIEYITLYNNLGRHEEALDLLMNRIFHPWEGGEGKVTSQYVIAHIEKAKLLIKENKYLEAIEHLHLAKIYPNNLGEGKLYGAQENNINYYLGISYELLEEKEKSKIYFEMASVGLEEPTDMMYYNDQPADTIFYQGLALIKLGRNTEAKGRFNRLYDYGEKHIFDKVKIDYFAVSLPDFLVFDENLDKKNQVHCNYLMALGTLGSGNIAKARRLFETATKLDINHQGIMIHRRELSQKL